jgi:putative peptidoglycan lipid II flippase
VTDDARSLVRATRGMTMVIAVSRLTGFVRLAVALAVLGTATQLGNVYQTANTVPTLLFELFAAGALQAALIPDLVERLDRGDRTGAGRMASSALLAGGVALGVLVVVSLAARAPIMAYFMRDVPASTRMEAEDLGRFMLWFFMPQLLLYLAGSVATAILNAQRRFYAPVFAPLVNNMVVIATLGVFALMRSGREPSLSLSAAERLVLAGGTTLGVLLFCSLPVVVALRTGFRLERPLPLRSAEFTGLMRSASWTIVFLALGQVLSIVVLPLTNAVAGHTLIWQTSWQVFLLPYALLAVPVLTARFPAMTSAIRSGDRDRYAGYVADGTRSVLTFGLFTGAAMVATGPLIARIVAFGGATEGVADLGAAIRGFGAGVAGYGILMFVARAWFAAGDARTPAIIQGGVVIVGAAGMLASVGAVPADARLLALSLSYSVANVLGAALALALLWFRHLHDRAPARPLPVGILRRVVAASLAGVVMWLVGRATPETRLAALAGLLIAGLVGAGTFILVQRLLGGPGLSETLRSMGGSDGPVPGIRQERAFDA